MPELNEIELLKVLLNKNATKNDLDTIFHKFGADFITNDGRSILNYSIIHKNDYLAQKCTLSKKCDINFQEKESGFSALHFAVQKNNLPIVKNLIKHGAIIDCVDRNGNTPLWRGIFDNVDENLILFLLKSGADEKKKNYHEVSPLDLLEQDTMKSIWEFINSK